MLSYKQIPFELTELKADDGQMSFSGYASTFGNLDHTGDVVMRGAFDATLASPTKRRLLWQHDMAEPIGVEQMLRTDDKGLFGTWKLSRTTRGLDAHELLKDGAVDSLSIGYIPRDFEFDDSGVRLLKSVDLLEVSLVSIPANDQALVSQVKALMEAGLLPDLDGKAEWSASFINNLPDSAFAVILPGGTKDSDGKTTPRSLRKLPHHNADGAVDMAHLRNAMSREPQTDMPDAAHSKAHAHLQGHMGGKTLDLDVPFDALLAQLAYGITYGADEAEGLWQRRLDDGREPKAEHLAAVTGLRAAVEAASARLTALLAQKSEAGADDAGDDQNPAEDAAVVPSAASADLSLRLELATRKLRSLGLLERAS